MSEAYWEDLYQKGDTRWEKGEPSPGLVDFLNAHPELPKGTVLVPGCGMGHDVREWARYGFTATGIDIAPSAVRLSTVRTAEAGLSSSAAFRLGSFLSEEAFAHFDYVFEHTLFCAIQKEEREAYVGAVRCWLKPTGTYVAIFYLISDEDGPPFGCTREEIAHRFSGSFELKEDWVPRSYPSRTGLEWMTVWKPKN
jgi:cyclopropane fatty-acyl-phospholipid synthase-like methyltransferase